MKIVPLLVSQYRIILISILFILLSLAFPLSQSHAQSNYYPNSSYMQPNTNPDVPQNLHTMTQSLFIDILSTGYCYLFGIDPSTQDHRCLGLDPNTKKIGYVSDQKQGGLLGFMTGTIASTYTFPSRTAGTLDYFHYLAGNFRGTGASKAYAQGQGVGFTGISPFIPIWVAIRNAVYLILVVIFVLVGLGIMLRIKIDPRTVMTLQNQIPKIIIGLILVTLSFAIAGFLIDMMYVVTLLFLNILNHAMPSFNQVSPSKLVEYSEPFSAVNDTIGNIAGLSKDTAGAISGIIKDAFGGIIAIVGIIFEIICVVAGILIPVAGFFICNAIGIGGAGLAELLLGILLGMAMLIALFRFWFALITAYITVLINAVLGPLFIILGVIPGVGAGFGQWVRDIVANLAIFPISFAFIYIIGMFVQVVNNADKSTIFTLPMAAGNLSAVMGFVGILMLPDLVKAVKGALKSKDFFNVQPHLGAGVAIAGGIAAIGANRLFRRANTYQGQAEGLGRQVIRRFGGRYGPSIIQLIERVAGELPSGGGGKP